MEESSKKAVGTILLLLSTPMIFFVVPGLLLTVYFFLGGPCPRARFNFGPGLLALFVTVFIVFFGFLLGRLATQILETSRQYLYMLPIVSLGLFVQYLIIIFFSCDSAIVLLGFWCMDIAVLILMFIACVVSQQEKMWVYALLPYAAIPVFILLSYCI